MTAQLKRFWCSSLWCRVPTFVILTCALLAILAGALAWDFFRWLLSPLWPIDNEHPERPGSHHPFK